ncbi:MAG: FG-GAP repeat domain-containing protein, partial [Candidatus Kariarchaeaceae archaeon]
MKKTLFVIIATLLILSTFSSFISPEEVIAAPITVDEKWSYYTGGFVSSSPAVADLGNDGELEVLVGSYNSLLYCFNSDGSLKWSYQTGDIIYSSPIVADLNNDGELEVLVGSYDGFLYCISSTGSLNW